MKTARTRYVIAFAVAFLPAAMGEDSSNGAEPQRTPQQVRMEVQGICPVSGQKLGSHGAPIAAKIGEQEMFLCCQGCTSGQVKPEHWTTIHSNFAKAQGVCPVMKHKLPDAPKWTIVKGRIVYVCCPPCITKIEAAPATYLQQVDELYLASLKKQEQGRQ